MSWNPLIDDFCSRFLFFIYRLLFFNPKTFAKNSCFCFSFASRWRSYFKLHHHHSLLTSSHRKTKFFFLQRRFQFVIHHFFDHILNKFSLISLNSTKKERKKKKSFLNLNLIMQRGGKCIHSERFRSTI